MKVRSSKLSRRAWRPAIGLIALGALVVGCGDKESNPDAVSFAELKFPGDLRILDKGNGAVALTWTGANNEDDFDGYNVYGLKGKAGDFGVTEGSALELLDEKGEPNEAARTVLGKFNFDPAKGLEAKGDSVNDDGEVEFSALPIHAKDGDKRLLPTCQQGAAGVCENTKTNVGKSVSDLSTLAVNGDITYSLDKLKPGSSYCFLVLSSMDGGQTVSQTSSNAECVVPKFKSEFSLTIPAATANNYEFDLRAYLASCTADSCAAPAAAIFKTEAKAHNAADTGAVYVESDVAFIAGKNSGVIDLGYYAKGFDDPTLPAKAPPLGIDTNTYGTNAGPIYNTGGYSIAGQSVPIVANHVYVIAVGDSAATGVSTKFHYHWLYVKSVGGGTSAVEMRLSKDAE